MIITSRVPYALESTAQTRCQAHLLAYLVMPAVMGKGRRCQKANGTPAPAQTAQLLDTMPPYVLSAHATWQSRDVRFLLRSDTMIQMA